MHHGHGRTMKIGKEEMIGLLAAVEMWVQRDHKKEDEMWTQWMQTIADRVTRIDGVSATVRQPRGLGNHSPGLSINWDAAKLGITGEAVSDILWTTEPRIAAQIHAALGDARTVCNVGAGTGSYEPVDRAVVAVEPSTTMLEQRAVGSAPAVRAFAEHLPFGDGVFA